jgi:hypothetical protein
MSSTISSIVQAVGIVLITVGIATFSVPVGVIVLGAALVLVGGLS